MTFKPLVSTPALVLYFLAAIVLIALWLVRTNAVALRRWGRAGLGIAVAGLVGIGLAGPTAVEESPTLSSNIEIVLAVDRTGSMAAEDGPDNAPRLDALKRDIATVIDTAPEARYAVVTWDSSSRVELPFTTDTSAVASFADALHQEISEFSVGSTVERPVAEIYALLRSAADERPANVRYLIIMTDGEDTATSEFGDGELDSGEFGEAGGWGSLAPLLDGGLVVGYGTEEGGPMKIFRAGGEGTTEGDYMEDEGGQTAISKMDPEGLKRVADLLDVPLLINPSEAEVTSEVETVLGLAETIEDDRRVDLIYRYYTWIPALLAGMLGAVAVGAFTHMAVRWKQTNAV